MAVWTAYSQVGIKEDVADVISNISPTKTPFQAMIGSRSVDNKLFSWQEDSLRAAAQNHKVEGFTATENSPVATVLRTNYTQILSETIRVSGTSDAIAHYGRAKESAYQLAKSMAQCKRDLEYAYVGGAQSSAAGNSSTERDMAGFQAQLWNDADASGALQLTTDAENAVKYTGSAATLPSEQNVLDVLTFLYNNGSEPDTIMVTPSNSLVVADFAKAAGRYRQVEDRKLMNVVDLYVSPFGQQRVVLNRFVHANNTLIFEKDMWQQAVLRSWFRETLAKTGDNVAMMIVGEYSLIHKNKAASAAIVEDDGPTGFVAG